jgi:hypothetical protein
MSFLKMHRHSKTPQRLRQAEVTISQLRQDRIILPFRENSQYFMRFLPAQEAVFYGLK